MHGKYEFKMSLISVQKARTGYVFIAIAAKLCVGQ